MKRFKYMGLIAVVMSMSMASCSDSFLELENPQGLDLRRTIVDVPTLRAASNGVYDKFQSIHYYNRSFLLYPEIVGDNMYVSRRNSGRYINYDFFRLNPEDGSATDTWFQMWRLIANANLAITQAENIEWMGGQLGEANEVLGELYAARALCYFDMLRLYAQPYNFTPDASHLGVPILIEAQTELIKPARETAAKSYEQVVSDLKTALNLMNSSIKPGRLTPVAVNALLAKVYLYMEDWENAEIYASEVIDGGTHQLLSTQNYVSSWAGRHSSESIFEVINSAIDRPGTDGIGYFVEQAGYGDGLATADLYQTYTATDVRRQLIEPGVRSGGENPAYFIKKYPNGVTNMDDNIKVIRLSEVYLIRAEARAELSLSNASYLSGALSDLNQIVLRADPQAAAVNVSGPSLIERILLERRKELAFEGNRLFDTNRKKRGISHIQSGRQEFLAYPNPGFILPISRTELQANPQMEQNPGYSTN